MQKVYTKGILVC